MSKIHHFHSTLLSFLVSLLVSCNPFGNNLPLSKSEIPGNATAIKIELNPDLVLIDTSYIMSTNLFDSVRFIPLETNYESTFSQISHCEVTKKFIFILDRSTQVALIFHKNGKFHRKLENIHSVSFSVDEVSERLFMHDNEDMGKINVYDFSGKLLSSINAPINYRNFTSVGYDKIWYYASFNKYARRGTNHGNEELYMYITMKVTPSFQFNAAA